ncbi:MAG: CBS domain-containing protein [Actinomycetota bacterium]|nr:CBS domain-containing protein [Actinomycetota bacterium]
MRVEALVSGESDVVGPETTLGDAADVLISRSIGALAVVDGRRLVGIVTDRDLVRAVSEGADIEEAVSEWMTDGPDTVPPDVSVSEAADWLLETGYRHLPVAVGDELLGIVDIRDVLWSLRKA